MNITLIGMAGVGKSTLGKKLARKLNYKFIDTDKVIEKKVNLKPQQIIDNFGDNELLKIEEKCVLELGKLDNYIISSGGSVIYSSEAMKFIKNNSTVIFLNDSFKNIQSRLTNQKTRGIIGLKNNNLIQLFNKRVVLYKKYADIIIDITNKFDVKEVIEEIIKGAKNNSYALG